MSLSPNEEDSIGFLGWVTVILGLIVAILLTWLVRTILRHRTLEQERVSGSNRTEPAANRTEPAANARCSPSCGRYSPPRTRRTHPTSIP